MVERCSIIRGTFWLLWSASLAYILLYNNCNDERNKWAIPTPSWMDWCPYVGKTLSKWFFKIIRKGWYYDGFIIRERRTFENMEKRIRKMEAYVGQSHQIYIFCIGNPYRHINSAFLIILTNFNSLTNNVGKSSFLLKTSIIVKNLLHIFLLLIYHSSWFDQWLVSFQF